MDRNDPKKTKKPFFVWYNPARMHVTTMLSPKYEAMLGVRGGNDWGIREAGMKQMDDNIGDVLKKIDDMGQTNNIERYWPASICFFSPSPLGPPAMSISVGNQSSAANS